MSKNAYMEQLTHIGPEILGGMALAMAESPKLAKIMADLVNNPSDDAKAFEALRIFLELLCHKAPDRCPVWVHRALAS